MTESFKDSKEKAPVFLKADFDGIEINGTQEFIQKTTAALKLLEGSRSFRKAKKYLGAIKESARSGMNARSNPPVYEVGRPTWSAETLWYASPIAHDTFHSVLYNGYKKFLQKEPPPDIWTGKNAEKRCLAFQNKALKELCATERSDSCEQMQEYLADLSVDPTYQGDPSSVEDYNKRNW